MKLRYEQILSITQGAVQIEQTEEGVWFHRFTEEQERGYGDSQFNPKQYATAGVRLNFKTDSKTLYMKVLTSVGSSRTFFAHDILVNGTLVGSLENGNKDVAGEFEQQFELGEGVKTVCIHFPWSVCSILKELELDAEEINKAIGGEVFCPWLAELRDDVEVDYISVAYGTNHWHKSTSEEFRVICEKFYDALVSNYPHAKILAITPIWRKDRTDLPTGFKNFEKIGEIIADVVKKYDQVTCISGRHFIPENEKLFSDLFLHPNDEGFKYYSESIKQAIQ